MKKIFIIFSLVLLIYMLWPGPGKISDFSPLPNSVKSQLSGDTWQVPDVVGYFSNNERDFVTKYYKGQFESLTKLPFPSLRLNHPPEFAYSAIKDQTESTYLEEFIYPLRNSVFVNGFEPLYSDGTPKFRGAHPYKVDRVIFNTKATVKFYPSSFIAKFMTWAGIIISFFLLYKMSRKILLNK